MRASAFAHPKSPHVAAVNERQFVSALQLVLPRKMDDGDGNASTSSEGFADVSEALRRRPRGSNDGSNSVPLELVGPAPGGDDFRVARMTLAQLVDENFLAQHVRPESGARLFACPLDGRLDGDDVAAITPSGHLRASLTPFTHARAGGHRRQTRPRDAQARGKRAPGQEGLCPWGALPRQARRLSPTAGRRGGRRGGARWVVRVRVREGGGR